jgi:hypothetical protein
MRKRQYAYGIAVQLSANQHLQYHQLYFGYFPIQKGAELEGRDFVYVEPIWIGRSAQVSSPRQLHLGSFLGVYQAAERKGVLGNRASGVKVFSETQKATRHEKSRGLTALALLTAHWLLLLR